jgi:hypothetical protein
LEVFFSLPHPIHTIAFLVCFFLSAGIVQAQSLATSTVNVAGGHGKTSAFSLDYSIGEQSSIVQYQSPASGSIAAGLLQALTSVITSMLPPPNSEGEALVLFPNPASEFSTLKGALSKPGYLSFELVDMQGRVLQSDPKTYFSRQVEKEFSLTGLSAGMYFIRVTYSAEGMTQTRTFKLIKAY